jgi:hypothetical protein
MSELSIERIKEIADHCGIEMRELPVGEAGGFMIKQSCETTKKLSIDELMECILPGSLELISRPYQVDIIKEKMNIQVAQYREALADDDSYSQSEADDELTNILTRMLQNERYVLLSYNKYSPMNGKLTLEQLWKSIAQGVFGEYAEIEWDEIRIPAPTSQKDFERFGDFIRYIARNYQISYQI